MTSRTMCDTLMCVHLVVNIHVNGFYSVWDMYHHAQCVIQYNVVVNIHENGFYSVMGYVLRKGKGCIYICTSEAEPKEVHTAEGGTIPCTVKTMR